MEFHDVYSEAEKLKLEFCEVAKLIEKFKKFNNYMPYKKIEVIFIKRLVDVYNGYILHIVNELKEMPDALLTVKEVEARLKEKAEGSFFEEDIREVISLTSDTIFKMNGIINSPAVYTKEYVEKVMLFLDSVIKLIDGFNCFNRKLELVIGINNKLK